MTISDPINEYLSRRSVLVLDGALATELERRGADLLDPLWSAKCLIEQPDLIRAVHRDYFAAGADVATTATYQATFEGYRRRGLDQDRATQSMRDAVTLAVSARDEFWGVPANRTDRERPLVAASIGPYGAMLADGSEYRGHYAVSDAQLRAFHAPRLEVLAESGADVLACETIPCLREAMVLAQLLQDCPRLTAWMSFSCRDGRHNAQGEDVAICAAELHPFSQVAAIGINCTPPEYVGELLLHMASRTDKPLVAYPNSGERYEAISKSWRGGSPSTPFAESVLGWYERGARLIGGCCRTTPSDIAATRSVLLEAVRSVF
jgi:homocysteine S-methyltransferase